LTPEAIRERIVCLKNFSTSEISAGRERLFPSNNGKCKKMKGGKMSQDYRGKEVFLLKGGKKDD
jgi:hypothetical protein